jgi:enediyne biosynthesis protein E4
MLWHNDGHGKFSDRALAAGCAYDYQGNTMAAMGLGVADYDNSGHQSIFVGNFSGQPNTLFQNDGSGQFRDVSLPAGVALPHMVFLTFGASFIDYDADGWRDLVNANGHVERRIASTSPGVTYAERKQLFRNDHGRFVEVVRDLGDLATKTVSRGLAVGDYDNDGRLDFLVNNQNGPAQLFHNDVKNSNHWISFKTVGTRSNRDGYGARFRLTASSGIYTAEVISGASYASQSDRRVYFGLGASRRVDRVQIRWPSGHVDTLTRVPVDESIEVTEGHGITATLPRKRSPVVRPSRRTET